MARGTTAVGETLALILVVFAAQVVGPFLGLGTGTFALALPLVNQPWTIVTSVYAHGSLDHLFANAVGVVVAGLLVARRTSRRRFHAFFVGTGALSGLAAVTAGALLGGGTAVLGASGAVFALVGYLFAGNLATESVLGRIELSRRASAVLVLLLAVALSIVTGGALVVLVAHATGFVLGLVTGRVHLLRPS